MGTRTSRAVRTSTVLAGALVLAGCALAPDTFVGPPPDVDHPVVCSTGENSGQCSSSAREADLRWAVGDVGFSVRLSVTEGDPEPSTSFDQVDGTMELENPDACPATVEWTLTPEPEPARPPAPPLTPAAPESASLEDDPIPAGTREIRLDLRRLDPDPCRAQVVWRDAGVE